MRSILWAGIAALCLGACATSDINEAMSEGRWITSWGTAQQLSPAAPPPFIRRDNAPPSPMVPYPQTLHDQTVRMIVRTSAGGSQFRLELSNASGGPAVHFGSVRAALAEEGSAIAPATDRAVTFSGKETLTLFPGARAVSDPIDMPLAPLTPIAVSLYLPHETPVNTVHSLGLNSAYIAAGNVTEAEELDAQDVARSYFWLTGLDILSTEPNAGAIVALGDSITDGYATTPGAFAAWPDLLAARLQDDPATAGLGVVNVGISGNRILRPGAGDAAVARFDEDVLTRSGVEWVILLQGINDINMSIMPIMPDSEDVTAAQIINGMDQLIARAHQHGLKIAGGTILPTKGLPFYSEDGERMRQEINDWIRTSGRFDAVIDFDAATRDPEDIIRLRPAYDPGDHVHPNDAGNRAMADAIDLDIFRERPQR